MAESGIYGNFTETLFAVKKKLELQVLAWNEEAAQRGEHKCFEHLTSRVKTERSMRDKLLRRGLEETTENALCRLTGETKIAAGGGFFAGTIAEICAEPTPGDYGHLCIDTDDMPRALAYYARRGIALDPEYTFRDEDGAIRLAYLKEKVGGFSIHLRRA